MISRNIEKNGVYKSDLERAVQCGGATLEKILRTDPRSAAESCVGIFHYAPLLILVIRHGKQLIQILGAAWVKLINSSVEDVEKGDAEKICNNLLKIDLGTQVDIFMRLVRSIRKNHIGSPY